MKKEIERLYLIYSNNFLTLENFAKEIKTTEKKALKIIELGRKIHYFNYTNKNLKL